MPITPAQELVAVTDPDDRRKLYRVLRDDEGVKVTLGERTVWHSKSRSRMLPNTAGVSAAAIRLLNAALAKIDPW